MPYFEVKTSVNVSEKTKEELYHELGRIIELVPGKSECWVMAQIQDNSSMCFAGDCSQPAAAVVLKTFGQLEAAHYELLTREICSRIGAMLGVDPKRIYVTYEPVTQWGWDGANF